MIIIYLKKKTSIYPVQVIAFVVFSEGI